MLITPHELHRHLHDPAWVVFDCRHDLIDHARGAKAYVEGHLPSARFAAVETDLCGPKNGHNGRHPLPTPAAFGRFLARAGVTPATTIVAYDDSGSVYATRLWWLARWIGHPRVLVLDGGLVAWLAEGLPTTPEPAAPAPETAAYPVQPGAMPVCEVDRVVANLATRRFLLLDARTSERFRGEVEPVDRVAGHIPGAGNRWHKMNLRSNATFRPEEELRQEFLALLGGRSASELVHYCGSGVTAGVNLFAMELAGLGGSQLYPGSWSEWVSDPGRPISTEAAPFVSS
jgi:thiosulfate/3-mercaptopyruvate sulfurtransferase